MPGGFKGKITGYQQAAAVTVRRLRLVRCKRPIQQTYAGPCSYGNPGTPRPDILRVQDSLVTNLSGTGFIGSRSTGLFVAAGGQYVATFQGQIGYSAHK